MLLGVFSKMNARHTISQKWFAPVKFKPARNMPTCGILKNALIHEAPPKQETRRWSSLRTRVARMAAELLKPVGNSRRHPQAAAMEKQ